MKKGVLVIFVILMTFLIVFPSILNSKTSYKIDKTVFSELRKSNETRVIINFNNVSSEEKEKIINETLRGKVIHNLNNTVSANVSEEDLKILESENAVNSVVKDGIKKIFLQDSVPLINATSVWNVQLNQINLTGKGQTVCILDTGTDFNHPDLQGKNLTCVVDCVGKSCRENCSVGDDNGHGTHVAGIVAANGSLKGVAPDANLISVKVCNSAGSCADSDIIAGMDFCTINSTQYNISVISLSLGSGQYSSYCDSTPPETSFASPINNAVSKNISVVVATGNDASTSGVSSPACIQNSIRVGDIYKKSYSGYTISWGSPVVCSDINPVLNQIVCHANRGSFFSDILFTYGALINSTWNNGGYKEEGGTSMATPHVSGSIALINQYEKLQSNKTLTPSEIKSALLNSGKNVSDSSTSSNYSRVDIYYSILELDQTPPQVNLTSPINSSLAPGNYTFSCNATDALQLSNLTLSIWNSSGLYYNATENATSNSLTLEKNVSLIQGQYNANCLAYDKQGNNATTSNFSIATLLVSNLESPSNNFSTNQNGTFVCDTSSYNLLSNVTFYLWNSSSELIYNETKSISGTSNTTEFYYNFTGEGNYSWNCLASDSSSSAYADSNYSITYDITSPNVTLISPENSYSTTSASVNFQYNVSETTISNCSLLLNNQSVKSNQSEITNSTNTITYTLSVGSHDWKINCIDKAGNYGNSSSRILTINSPPSSPTGSSSGGGSSTPSSSTETSAPEILINETTLIEGTNREIAQNQKTNLNINNQNYTFTINSLSSLEAIFTISNSTNNLISIAQTRKIDLNHDGFYDLEITLIGISNNKANLILKKVHEEIPIREAFNNSTNQNETKSETPEVKSKTNIFDRIIKFLEKIFPWISKFRK